MAEALVRTSRALAESRRHTDAALAGEPWPDRVSRDARQVAEDYALTREALATDRDRAAAGARATADQARGRIGLVDRVGKMIGIRTRAVQVADQTEAKASQAEAAHTYVGDSDQQTRLDSYRATRAVAGREAERAVWQARPEVAQAIRQAHGDQLVHEAIAAGDANIIHLAGMDLQTAREAVLRREAEHAKAAAEEAKHELAVATAARQAEHATRMQGYQPVAAPGGSGKR